MNQTSPANYHKSHKLLWILLIISIIIIMTPILILGWMGLVPGVSNLMGTANPRDLGVNYSVNDVANYKQKTGIKLIDDTLAPVSPGNPSEKTILANVVNVDNIELSQEEITALIDSNVRSWMPINNTQVRITDGILEISGSVDVNKIEDFYDYVSNGKAISTDVENAFSWARMFRDNAPVYAKAEANITNNQLSFHLLNAEIGRFSLPLGETGDKLSSKGFMANVKSEYFDSDSARLVDGKLVFSGSYPSTLYLKP